VLPIKYEPAAAKYLRKLVEKPLKKRYQEAIEAIRADPTIGEMKTGDLAGIYCYDIFYQKTNYEIAYRVEIIIHPSGERETVVVIIAGARENFYKTLKRYLN
jgi:mRNA interferase RelE/StbE